MIRRILRGRDPVVAMAGVALVDVRDVAEMHLTFISPGKAVTAAAAWLVTAGEVWRERFDRRRSQPKAVRYRIATVQHQIDHHLCNLGRHAVPDLETAIGNIMPGAVRPAAH